MPRMVPVLIIFKVEISVASMLKERKGTARASGAGGTGAQVMRADARGGVKRDARGPPRSRNRRRGQSGAGIWIRELDSRSRVHVLASRDFYRACGPQLLIQPAPKSHELFHGLLYRRAFGDSEPTGSGILIRCPCKGAARWYLGGDFSLPLLFLSFRFAFFFPATRSLAAITIFVLLEIDFGWYGGCAVVARYSDSRDYREIVRLPFETC